MSNLSSLNLSYKHIFWGMVAISTFSLILAFFVEYALNIPPCTLCIYQRIPYAALILIALTAIYCNKYTKIFFAALMLAIISSIIISGYHSSVERGFLEGSSICNPDVLMPYDLTSEQIKEMLYNREVATCTKAPFKIMLLSMTEWNCLFNIGLLYLLLYIKRYINIK